MLEKIGEKRRKAGNGEQDLGRHRIAKRLKKKKTQRKNKTK